MRKNKHYLVLKQIKNSTYSMGKKYLDNNGSLIKTLYIICRIIVK